MGCYGSFGMNGNNLGGFFFFSPWLLKTEVDETERLCR